MIIRFWGFFIPYEHCRNVSAMGVVTYTCTNNVTGKIDATANLYHDQLQTPGWTGGGNGGPDGVCHGDTKGNSVGGATQSGMCDCGVGVACGEYLFDHRNGSILTKWFTEQYIGGTTYGLGNANVSGFYLDDSWNSESYLDFYRRTTHSHTLTLFFVLFFVTELSTHFMITMN